MDNAVFKAKYIVSLLDCMIKAKSKNEVDDIYSEIKVNLDELVKIIQEKD